MYPLSKLKKSYEIYISPTFKVNESQTEVNSEPIFYSTTFLKNIQKPVSSMQLKVPLMHFDESGKKNFFLEYSVKSIDHQKNIVNANLKSLKPMHTTVSSSKIGFNKSLHVKTKNLSIELKVLLNKETALKCSRSTRVKIGQKVTAAVLKDQNHLFENLEILIQSILNNSIKNYILSEVPQYVEYIKNILIISVSKR